MKNFRIEVDGCVVKEFKNFCPAYKFFLNKSKNNKNNRVNLYELKSHAFGQTTCDDYVLIKYN